MPWRRLIIVVILVGAGLWFGARALVAARLDRDLLSRELGRALGQPVTLQDYSLDWDGNVQLDGLTVGQNLRVRRAETVLPWRELLQGQVRPRRLELVAPVLTWGELGSGATPDFPIYFTEGSLRREGHPPLEPLDGEWAEGKLRVHHPKAGTWRWDGSRLAVDGLPLKWASAWLGHPLSVAGTVTGNLTWQGDEVVVRASTTVGVKDLEAIVIPSRREVRSAAAETPWGPVRLAGVLSEAGPQGWLEWRKVHVDASGTWNEPVLAFRTPQLRGTARLREGRWEGKVTGPEGLELKLAEGKIAGRVRQVPVHGHWKGTAVHLEAGGVRLGRGQVDLTVDGDVVTQEARGEARVTGLGGPPARVLMELKAGEVRLTALELDGVSPPPAINGTIYPAVKAELGLSGQTVTVKDWKGQLFGKLNVTGERAQWKGEAKGLEGPGVKAPLVQGEGSGPPWRGRLDAPEVSVDSQGVTGKLKVQAQWPDRIELSSANLHYRNHALPALTLKGRLLPEGFALAGQALGGKVTVRQGRAGLQGSFQGPLDYAGFKEAKAVVKAQGKPGQRTLVTARLPHPSWNGRALPALQATLSVGPSNTTVDKLILESKPPLTAKGVMSHKPLSGRLSSTLKNAPLALLPYPVNGTVTGNLSVEGDAAAQKMRFAGMATELAGWGLRVGTGRLAVNASQPPLAFSAQGLGFQPERLSFLAERYPGLHGSMRFQATEKGAEVHLEALVQGQQKLPDLGVWLTPQGVAEKLLVATSPPLELAGALQPLDLKGNLTGQTLGQLLLLAGGRPNPDVSVRLTGPVTLKGAALTFQGTVQELVYKGAPLGSGRLHLVSEPALDGRLVLDRPIPVSQVASYGLLPPALSNPLAQILGGTVLARIQVTGVRLGGALEAPRLTPEFSGG